MSSQCYVICPHCGGTGTVTMREGASECQRCVLVRCIPVQTLLTTARSLAHELARARLRLAALDGRDVPPAAPAPPRKVAGERIAPVGEIDPEEEDRMDAE